jgi:transposase
MSDEPILFVGVDWGREEHVVVAMDGDGKEVFETRVKHSGAALHGFAERLARQGQASRIAIGIEIPRGALVETLLERGFRVFALNPKQLDRFRDRFFPAGAKDDSKDAMVLASSLRTDRRAYREVELSEPLVLQLREHVRMHEDLREEANRLTNRLVDLLHRYFAQLLELGVSGNEPWVLDLLEKAPTPESARRLRSTTIARILKAHRIRKHSAEDVVAALKEPDLHLAPGAVDAASSHVLVLIPRLRLVHEQQKQVDKRLQILLLAHSKAEELSSPEDHEHRDVQILQSMPGYGKVTVATMLAEADLMLRDRDYDALRAHGGVAPITKQTGKQRHGGRRRPNISMRRACNGRLRNALYHSARVAVQRDPASKARYQRLRARGHSHGRALRSVADTNLRVLVACLRNHTLYDPTKPRSVPPTETRDRAARSDEVASTAPQSQGIGA